jgi:putative ABC transport system permease protein
MVPYQHTFGTGGQQGIEVSFMGVVGRASPGGAVDRLTVESGRWLQASGEAVVSQTLADRWQLKPGEMLSPGPGTHAPSLRIVGIAASVNSAADLWVTPAQAMAMAGSGSPLQHQMVYRVRQAATSAQLSSAASAITAGLPAGAVVSVQNYLDVKRSADLTSAVMVPFLLAFSAFALAATVLIIANIIGGVVIAGYREIGVMKAVGFDPAGVVSVLLAEVLIPAGLAALVGTVLGIALSRPFLSQTAHALGLPAPYTAELPVALAVLAFVLAAVLLSALIPATRAARLSATAAIARGAAPSAGAGSRLDRAVGALPIPLILRMGLSDIVARPLRALLTGGAILVGVATVVFALSLHLSLDAVAAHLDRSSYAQVEVDFPGAGGNIKAAPVGAPLPQFASPAQVTTLLHRSSATARFVAEGQDQISVPGVAQQVPYIAYRGPSSWLGYALIAGRWFSHPGEVVAPTRLLTEAHLHVGDTITARFNQKSMRLRIVGEIFDQEYGDLLLRGSWGTLHAADPRLQVDRFEVQLRPGTDAMQLVYTLRRANAAADSTARDDTTFLLIQSVVATLALVLVLIAVAGVFNTAVLGTRERARPIAILKAVGMGPRRVVGMILTSVCLLAIPAGAAAIPAGLGLHRQVLTLMGSVARGTGIPPAFFELIGPEGLALLALAGVLLAAGGALLPAWWAARAPVATVLQAE